MIHLKNNYDLNISLSFGKRLRLAREQLGLSQQMVAKYLCLNVSIIRDIEIEKISTDLSLIFIRGYIRSYAKLLRFSDEEIFNLLEKQMPTNKNKFTLTYSFLYKKKYRKLNNLLTYFNWIMLFLIISLTGVWWWQNYKTQQEEIIDMFKKHNLCTKCIYSNIYYIIINKTIYFIDK